MFVCLIPLGARGKRMCSREELGWFKNFMFVSSQRFPTHQKAVREYCKGTKISLNHYAICIGRIIAKNNIYFVQPTITGHHFLVISPVWLAFIVITVDNKHRSCHHPDFLCKSLRPLCLCLEWIFQTEKKLLAGKKEQLWIKRKRKWLLVSCGGSGWRWWW